MSRTLGLDDIPLDVFRGVVAFGMGRFTVGRLDGGMAQASRATRCSPNCH